MALLITMNSEGRLTVPAAARHELGVEGETQFQAEVCDGALVLRPAIVIPREDAWAYTPENLATIQKGLRDSREGRVRELSEADLDELANDVP